MGISKVAAINDLSGFGKCSLTAALPILAAMGVQACPLPTAALSSQTAFPDFVCVDLSGHFDAFSRQWRGMNPVFQGIYSGFLFNEQQVAQVEQFLDLFADNHATVVVDPVFGDEGHYYPIFHDGMRDALLHLIRRADLITPNLTEACLLTGRSYGQVAEAENPLDPAQEIARTLAALGPGQVVITGIHLPGAQIATLGYVADQDRAFVVQNRRVGSGYYSGTGDIMASILCGSLLRGDTLEQGVRLAAALLEQAITKSYQDGTDPREGIAFEPYLPLLLPRGEKQ